MWKNQNTGNEINKSEMKGLNEVIESEKDAKQNKMWLDRNSANLYKLQYNKIALEILFWKGKNMAQINDTCIFASYLSDMIILGKFTIFIKHLRTTLERHKIKLLKANT